MRAVYRFRSDSYPVSIEPTAPPVRRPSYLRPSEVNTSLVGNILQHFARFRFSNVLADLAPAQISDFPQLPCMFSSASPFASARHRMFKYHRSRNDALKFLCGTCRCDVTAPPLTIRPYSVRNFYLVESPGGMRETGGAGQCRGTQHRCLCNKRAQPVQLRGFGKFFFRIGKF